MPPVAPSEYPPPFDSESVITAPTDPEDERIEVGVAIVGGGPAGLAAAVKTLQLLEDKPELMEKLGEVPVAVVEKGKVCGAHAMSGANMRPSAMEELFPDMPRDEWPVYREVDKDAVYLLTEKLALPLKPMPPNFKNHGNYVTSVAKLSRFLADKAEDMGAYILTETAADHLLVEDQIVKGIRSGDRGRGRDGQELGNFEPGMDLVAKATVLAEGTLGHLTYAALDHFDINGLDPQRWELGVKEIWEVEEPLDQVIHTMGWPLRKAAKYKEFGGSFIYPMEDNKVCIGFVVGLDYTDATLSVHDLLQQFKLHPFVKKILKGGKRVGWGAKTIPAGGYWSMPKRLSVPGMVIAGDNAGMVNVAELKGVHYAMHAGMYAAEAIVDALEKDQVDFSAYDEKVHNSLIEKDLYKVRNASQPFTKGFFLGGAAASAMTLTGGHFPGGHWKNHDDATYKVELGKAADNYPEPDGEYTFDKLSSVFLSGNATRDDAPNHVRIQTEVPREIAQTWVSMCPAQVYEIPEDQLESNAPIVDVHVTASNCVQCGAITAKGGRLTLPEGGDGPLYTET
ncbi:MAG: 4Fe-4S dicluster domain-containing protein [Solirubrobacterales bacterium]|nr:4Fe-4S dicluster domain-containing protein [Solirubrobacterales bacterium]MCB0870708.1 4Fe-4S dicluster domain-containing protein [Solirubrobacterales bacterium]